MSFGLLVILGTVIAGPFDTLSRLDLGARIVFWGGIVVTSVFAAAMVQKLLKGFMRRAPDWLSILADTVAMTFVFAPFVHFWKTLFFAPDERHFGFGEVVLNVALLSLVVFALRKLTFDWARLATFERSQSGSMPDMGDTVQTTAPRLNRRIDAGDPGPILQISAGNHFVHLMTPRAEYQVRMRFADAVAEMYGIDGYLVHRSHWVAREIVSDVERDNGRLFLRLTCGKRIPVSRKNRTVLEEAGLI